MNCTTYRGYKSEVHMPIILIPLSSCAPARYESYPRVTYAVASWYGPDFHGRPTTSGELFDMNALTCAHREYPFGTKLKVMNVSNDRTVNCLVNDRGPFIGGSVGFDEIRNNW
jgi:rare lipoprotein A